MFIFGVTVVLYFLLSVINPVLLRVEDYLYSTAFTVLPILMAELLLQKKNKV